jgi:MFS family permease
MGNEKGKATKIGGRNWLIIVLLGLAGQIAWNVENSWFNTFVFDTITPDPKPIAWMVAISAITATITTLVMGTISDRFGKRKPFILYGYILWGISTIIFPTTAFIKATSLAVIMVITADALMTFFGSTAYDAAFNAWTTDISDNTNRGTLSGVITIFPLLAALIGAGLSGILIDKLGYYTFFYALGGVVGLMGLIGGFMLKDSPNLYKISRDETKSFIIHLFSVFKPEVIKQNKEMFLVFTSMLLYSIGMQVFLPYQMIYMNNYLNMSKTTAGAITAIPVLLAMLIAVPAGKLADKGHGAKLAMLSPFISFGGLILFSLSRGIYQIMITGSLIYIGFVILLLSIGAWIKNLMPEENRGQFEGVRMIFNVAIPMIIGPAIGSFLITNYGIPTILNGEAGFVPTPIVFQAAGILCVTSIIPLIIIMKNKKHLSITKPGDKEGASYGE